MSDEHPTMKPVGLVEKAISNSSGAGEIVLDLFGGSGTTMLAAEQCGRVAYLSEMEAKFGAVTLERMSALGLSPELVK